MILKVLSERQDSYQNMLSAFPSSAFGWLTPPFDLISSGIYNTLHESMRSMCYIHMDLGERHKNAACFFTFSHSIIHL